MRYCFLFHSNRQQALEDFYAKGPHAHAHAHATHRTGSLKEAGGKIVLTGPGHNPILSLYNEGTKLPNFIGVTSSRFYVGFAIRINELSLPPVTVSHHLVACSVSLSASSIKKTDETAAQRSGTRQSELTFMKPSLHVILSDI